MTKPGPPVSRSSTWTRRRRVIWCASVFAFVLALSVAFYPVFGEGRTLWQSLLVAVPIGVAAAAGIFVGARPRI
jgi:hypothetical protein